MLPVSALPAAKGREPRGREVCTHPVLGECTAAGEVECTEEVARDRQLWREEIGGRGGEGGDGREGRGGESEELIQVERKEAYKYQK